MGYSYYISPLVLNIAGPRESGCPGIQARGKEFLMKVLG